MKDRNHPEIDKIYEELKEILNAGYETIDTTKWTTRDVEIEIEKERKTKFFVIAIALMKKANNYFQNILYSF